MCWVQGTETKVLVPKEKSWGNSLNMEAKWLHSITHMGVSTLKQIGLLDQRREGMEWDDERRWQQNTGGKQQVEKFLFSVVETVWCQFNTFRHRKNKWIHMKRRKQIYFCLASRSTHQIWIFIKIMFKAIKSVVPEITLRFQKRPEDRWFPQHNFIWIFRNTSLEF